MKEWWPTMTDKNMDRIVTMIIRFLNGMIIVCVILAVTFYGLAIFAAFGIHP